MNMSKRTNHLNGYERLIVDSFDNDISADPPHHENCKNNSTLSTIDDTVDDNSYDIVFSPRHDDDDDDDYTDASYHEIDCMRNHRHSSSSSSSYSENLVPRSFNCKRDTTGNSYLKIFTNYESDDDMQTISSSQENESNSIESLFNHYINLLKKLPGDLLNCNNSLADSFAPWISPKTYCSDNNIEMEWSGSKSCAQNRAENTTSSTAVFFPNDEDCSKNGSKDQKPKSPPKRSFIKLDKSLEKKDGVNLSIQNSQILTPVNLRDLNTTYDMSKFTDFVMKDCVRTCSSQEGVLPYNKTSLNSKKVNRNGLSNSGPVIQKRHFVSSLCTGEGTSCYDAALKTSSNTCLSNLRSLLPDSKVNTFFSNNSRKSLYYRKLGESEDCVSLLNKKQLPQQMDASSEDKSIPRIVATGGVSKEKDNTDRLDMNKTPKIGNSSRSRNSQDTNTTDVTNGTIESIAVMMTTSDGHIILRPLGKSEQLKSAYYQSLLKALDRNEDKVLSLSLKHGRIIQNDKDENNPSVTKVHRTKGLKRKKINNGKNPKCWPSTNVRITKIYSKRQESIKIPHNSSDSDKKFLLDN